MQGQPDSALKCSLEALEIFRQLAYVGGEANASHNIGNLFLDQGKGDSAQVYLRASFEMFKAIGNESGVARVISSFGLVALQRGDLSQAEKLERIALQTFVRIGNIEGQFKALTNLGAVFYERDMIREALNTSHKTILLASMMGDSLGMLTANSNIALLLNFQGKVDEALQLERAGLKYARSHGMKEQTAMVLTNLAASYARKGQTELFLEAYTEAYNIFAELREVPKHVLMLQVLGDVLAGSKDFKGALNLGSLALQAASQVGNYREMVKILRSMSRWSAAVGDRRRARECALKAAEIERAGTNPSTVKRDEI
jgi:tetratricopeptide (TPR) repeat protein